VRKGWYGRVEKGGWTLKGWQLWPEMWEMKREIEMVQENENEKEKLTIQMNKTRVITKNLKIDSANILLYESM
jgi:hypothetical protein